MYRPGVQINPQQGAAQEQVSRIPGISNAAALPFPTEGEIKATGEPVTFLQTCNLENWPGHSPSLVGVDAQGEFLISSFPESRATDPKVVPNLNARGGQPQQRQMPYRQQ